MSLNLVLFSAALGVVKVKMLLEGSEQALTMKAETFETGQTLTEDEEDDNKSCSITQVVEVLRNTAATVLNLILWAWVKMPA